MDQDNERAKWALQELIEEMIEQRLGRIRSSSDRIRLEEKMNHFFDRLDELGALMGSVEHDELMHDGGNRLAAQEQIDLEEQAMRNAAQRRVMGALARRDPQSVEYATDIAIDAIGPAVRMFMIGNRKEAMREFERICRHAIESLVEIEARSVTAQEIREELE